MEHIDFSAFSPWAQERLLTDPLSPFYVRRNTPKQYICKRCGDVVSDEEYCDNNGLCEDCVDFVDEMEATLDVRYY